MIQRGETPHDGQHRVGRVGHPETDVERLVAFAHRSRFVLETGRRLEDRIQQTEGVDLQMVLVASTIQVAALTTGDIDFSGAQSQVMAGAARGLPVKVVGFLTIKPSFWLMSKPEIKSMADLKGKIIGITAIGSSTDTLARFLLTKNGLTPDREVALIGTGTTSNILTAMKAGTVDAGVLSPPFNAMATQMGYRTLAYFGDYVEQSLSGVGTSDKMIRERPELVRRMLVLLCH